MRMKKWEAVGFPFFCLLVFRGHFIKGRIVRVEVLGIQGVLGDPQSLGETIKGEWILRYPFLYVFIFSI